MKVGEVKNVSCIRTVFVVFNRKSYFSEGWEMMVKSCKTCDRRDLQLPGITVCNYTGYLCETERRHPNRCGKDYEHGWVQRRSFWKRLFGVNK